MFDDHYAAVGLSAIENIRCGLEQTGRSFRDIRAALDLPSGYGRVLRWLVKEIPPARIAACDINEQAIRFCSREFGVSAFRSRDDFDLRLPGRYDLIWVGSLFTHISEDNGRMLLSSLTASLDGVLIFSTCGPEHLEELSRYGPEFAAAKDDLRRQMSSSGHAFTRYAAQPILGMAFHSPEYVSRLLAEFGLLVALHRPRGWAEDQDVWTAVRSRRYLP